MVNTFSSCIPLSTLEKPEKQVSLLLQLLQNIPRLFLLPAEWGHSFPHGQGLISLCVKFALQYLDSTGCGLDTQQAWP